MLVATEKEFQTRLVSALQNNGCKTTDGVLMNTSAALSLEEMKNKEHSKDPIFHFERFVWKEGGGVLRCNDKEVGFISNIGTKNGTTRWYTLFEKVV